MKNKALISDFAFLVNKTFVRSSLLRPESVVEFVGVVMRENGKEYVRKVSFPVLIDKNDVLEIELAGGIYIKMSRVKETVFKGDYTGNRAERRREDRQVRALRLITLE
jgi:hypothetical protein